MEFILHEEVKDEAFNILVIGDCIASYITFKYLGRDDEAPNPIHYMMGSVVRDINVISERSGTELVLHIRKCGYAFSNYKFQTGFEELDIAMGLKDEVDKIEDELLREKVREYLSFDFGLVRDLQKEYETECRKSILDNAKRKIQEAKLGGRLM